jgi:poly-beta-1,6-N-acetyl-D-glucosamine synthase
MSEMNLFDFTVGPKLAILVIFGIGLLVQISIYLFRYLPVALHKRTKFDAELPSVSIIICARNEEERLQEFLPQVLQQDYPHFEVIVVNDCSWDNSYDLLKEMALRFKNLKVADIKEVEGREHGKKFALTIGIKAASYDTLVLTDADCYPNTDQWLKSMMEAASGGETIVLGYGKYERRPGFLNNMIRFDAFTIACTYFGMSLRGNTYMGVGRNLSYKRDLFFSVKGFASHIHLASGDDDLFINEVATKNNVAIAAHPEAITITLPRLTWKSWLMQKKRHLTTARVYKRKHQNLLLLDPVTWYLMFFSALVGIIIQYNVLILISGLILRAFIQIAILHAIGKKLDDKDLGWKAPFLELFHRLFLSPIFAFSTLFVRKSKWT